MDEYEYVVILKVKVPAFSMQDADMVIEDAFGVGEQCGALVYDSEVRALGVVKN